MPLDIDPAKKFAQHLTSIPGCPRGDAALEAVIDTMCRFCDNEDEAKWLVGEACNTWHEWKGPAGLRELLYDHKYPEQPPSNQAQDYGPLPTGTCKLCNDFGHFTDESDPQKLRQWCTCEMGVWQKQRHRGLVDALNKSRLAKPLVRRRTPRTPGGLVEALTESQSVKQQSWNAPTTAEEESSSPDWLKAIDPLEKAE